MCQLDYRWFVIEGKIHSNASEVLGLEQGSLPSETLESGSLQIGQSRVLLNRPFGGHLPHGSSVKRAAPSFLRRDHPVPADGSPTIAEGMQSIGL